MADPKEYKLDWQPLPWSEAGEVNFVAWPALVAESKPVEQPGTLQALMDAYNTLRERIAPGRWRPECFYTNPDLKVFDRINELNQSPTPPLPGYLGESERVLAILTGIRVESHLMVPSLMLMYRGEDGATFIFLDFRTEQERADARAIAELRMK